MSAAPIDPRTLFPRACTGCGAPKCRDDFPTSTKQHPHRRCHDCFRQEWTERNARREFGAWSKGQPDATGRAAPADPLSLFPRNCSACGTPRARSDFRTYRGVAHRVCRDCQARQDRLRREQDIEWAREQGRRRYAADAARRRESARRYRIANLEREREADRLYYEANIEQERTRHREYASEVHAETRENAKHHGEEWTSAQLEIAERRSLAAREVALMLGRTQYAVKRVRRLIDAGDPRTLSKLGYDPAKEH